MKMGLEVSVSKEYESGKPSRRKRLKYVSEKNEKKPEDYTGMLYLI